MKNNKNWYAVNTYSGHEKKVKENIKRRISSMEIKKYIFSILVAEEKEIGFKKGKKIEKMKNLFPGYIFLKMIMTDKTWFVLRNTPGVTGFVGSAGKGKKPFPMSDLEMENILRRIGISKKNLAINFKIGDTVKILSGPFTGMKGLIDRIDKSSETVMVLLILFGRETPSEFSFVDIEKI